MTTLIKPFEFASAPRLADHGLPLSRTFFNSNRLFTWTMRTFLQIYVMKATLDPLSNLRLEPFVSNSYIRFKDDESAIFDRMTLS